MKREKMLLHEQNSCELVCPLCDTANTFSAKSPLPFLHCSSCKYVYAWKTDKNEITIERKE